LSTIIYALKVIEPRKITVPPVGISAALTVVKAWPDPEAVIPIDFVFSLMVNFISVKLAFLFKPRVFDGFLGTYS